MASLSLYAQESTVWTRQLSQKYGANPKFEKVSIHDSAVGAEHP
jgi:hypothetical protein